MRLTLATKLLLTAATGLVAVGLVALTPPGRPAAEQPPVVILKEIPAPYDCPA